jgi:hypothetical protein
MSVTLLSLHDAGRWNAVLEEFPQEDRQVHFRAEYHRLFEANGDGQAEMFVVREGGNLLVYPYMKGRIRAIGATLIRDDVFDIQSVFGYTGPRANTVDKAFLRRANEVFEAYCRESKIVAEFVRFNPVLENHSALEDANRMEIRRLQSFVAVHLAKDEPALMRAYRKGRRSDIRQAQRLQMEFRPLDRKDEFNCFVEGYRAHMVSIGADRYYLFSDAYFEALYGLHHRLVLLAGAYCGDQLLAAGAFAFDGGTAYYLHGMRTTNDTRHQGATSFLLHSVFGALGAAGVRVFVLGGGVGKGGDDRLLHYKRGFSKAGMDLHIGKRIHDATRYEELCMTWEREFPKLRERRANFVLKYRFTE